MFQGSVIGLAWLGLPIKDVIFGLCKIVKHILLVIFVVKNNRFTSYLLFDFSQYTLQSLTLFANRIMGVITLCLKSFITVITESKITAVVCTGARLAISAVNWILCFQVAFALLQTCLVFLAPSYFSSNDCSSSTIFSSDSKPAAPSVAMLSNPLGRFSHLKNLVESPNT